MDAIAIGGGALLGAVLSALALFFTFDRKFKRYVQDAAGIREGTVTEIKPSPLVIKNEVRYATFAELEEAKREARQRHEEFEKRASEFRKRTESKLTEIDKHVGGIPHQVIALLRDTKGLI